MSNCGLFSSRARFRRSTERLIGVKGFLICVGDLARHLAPGGVLLGLDEASTALGEFAGHVVERPGEIAELVLRADVDPRVEIAGRDALRLLLQSPDRRRRAARDEHRARDDDAQCENRCGDEDAVQVVHHGVDVVVVDADSEHPAKAALRRPGAAPERGRLRQASERVRRVHVPILLARGRGELGRSIGASETFRV